MRATYLAIGVCVVAVAVLVSNAVSSDRLDRAQLAERMVGIDKIAPLDMCCVKAELKTCGAKLADLCAPNPYCPMRQDVDSSCVNPTCNACLITGATCSTPALPMSKVYPSCTLTGQTGICQPQTSPVKKYCIPAFCGNVQVHGHY